MTRIFIIGIMVIFYFINWIVASETIEGGKLFKGIRGNTVPYAAQQRLILHGMDILLLNDMNITCSFH